MSASHQCLRAQTQDWTSQNCCFPNCCCPCCCCRSCQCRCCQRQSCGSRRCRVRYCPGCRRYTWWRLPGGTPPQSARSRKATSTRRQRIGQWRRQHPPARPESQPCSYRPWINLSACKHKNGADVFLCSAGSLGTGGKIALASRGPPAKGIRRRLPDHVGHAAARDYVRSEVLLRRGIKRHIVLN